MTRSKPKLMTFGISHYCEKARWALDRLGVAYEEIGWPPGVHILQTKWYGAKATTLPIVLDGDRVIQGSGAIVDWADRQAQAAANGFTSATALDIEKRADDVLGVQIRRLYYAETLPNSPELVKPHMFLNASLTHRLIGNVMWPVSRRVMMQMYDITPTAIAETRANLENELDWLDLQLADGRPYLTGDCFSRADVSVASMLAFFAGPEEMPVYHGMTMPNALANTLDGWRDRPVMEWVTNLYRTERHAT